MSRYSGLQGPGARRRHREQARAEAQERDARTLPQRTARYRRDLARIRVALDDRERAVLRDALVGAS